MYSDGSIANPPNLSGIENNELLIPNVPQVAVFDTAFHQTMPKHAYIYGIPYSLYKNTVYVVMDFMELATAMYPKSMRIFRC